MSLIFFTGNDGIYQTASPQRTKPKILILMILVKKFLGQGYQKISRYLVNPASFSSKIMQSNLWYSLREKIAKPENTKKI